MGDGESAVRSAMRRLLEVAGVRPAEHGPGRAGLHHLEIGSGRPIVLVHGGSGGGANWFRLLGPLSERFRVLAPDLPGFGLSPRVAAARPLGPAAAARLHEWMAEHDVRDAIVAGTSFGGLAALRLAQRAPDRVAGLLLLDSAGLGPELHYAVRMAAVPGLTRLAVRPTRRGTDLLFRTMLTRNRAGLDAAVADALVDYLHASATAAGTAWLAATLRAFATPRGQREVVGPGELAALAQPVSFVWGELDTFLPADHARRAAAHCRDGRALIIPGAGHSPNWETPAAVLAAFHELADRAHR
jgi:pimeloyl-ACP methyl ester carboxylesterase